MTSSPRTLVTGATGLVGSELVHQLLREGGSVRIFRRETSSLSLLGAAAESVEHAVGDLRDARSLLEAMEGVDRVYHAAAKVSFGPGQHDMLHAVNVKGTGNVVNAALRSGVRRLVHTSSMAAFGRPGLRGAARSGDSSPTVPMIDEETRWDGDENRSAYALSKYESELEVHRGIAEGIDAVIVNPSLIFGVGRRGHNTRRIVDLVRSGWAKAVPPGSTNVVDVRDVAVGMRRAMEDGETGCRYFLGSENVSWNHVVSTLAVAFGEDPPTRTIPPLLLHAAAWVSEAVSMVTRQKAGLTREHVRTSTSEHRYSNERAQSELGCQFRSFGETAAWLAEELGEVVSTKRAR